MKLYRLFYDDVTDLNGENIQVGKIYTKENLDKEQLYAYFNLEDLYEEYDMNRSEQNFKVYEVDLNNNICAFTKDLCYDESMVCIDEINYLSGDNLTILNEIDYSTFNDKGVVQLKI